LTFHSTEQAYPSGAPTIIFCISQRRQNGVFPTCRHDIASRKAEPFLGHKFGTAWTFRKRRTKDPRAAALARNSTNTGTNLYVIIPWSYGKCGGPVSSMWHEFQFFAAKGFGVVYCNPRDQADTARDLCAIAAADWGAGPTSDVYCRLFDQTFGWLIPPNWW